jgi:hypothetical protein
MLVYNELMFKSFNVFMPNYEELYGPAVSALWYAIAEVKQRWSVIGWVTKNLLSRASRAVVSTHQSALGPRGGL